MPLSGKGPSESKGRRSVECGYAADAANVRAAESRSSGGRSMISCSARLIAAAAILPLAAVACADDFVEVRGVLEHYADTVRLELPDHLDAGFPAAVTVWTYGNPVCDRVGPTYHAVDGMLVVIEPYDLVRSPSAGRSCPDIVGAFEHTVHVELSQTGTATVRVIGRRMPGDAIITVERELGVR